MIGSLALLLSGAVLFMLGSGLKRKEGKYGNFIQVPGLVVDAFIVQPVDMTSLPFEVEVVFHYEYEGLIYTSRQVHPPAQFETQKKAQRFLENLSREILVSVDTSQSSNGVWVRAGRWYQLLLLGGAFLVLLSLGLLLV